MKFLNACYYHIKDTYTGGEQKKEPPIKDDIPWSLPLYVMKELIKIVYFNTLVRLDTCFNKNGDSKSQIRKLHVV